MGFFGAGGLQLSLTFYSTQNASEMSGGHPWILGFAARAVHLSSYTKKGEEESAESEMTCGQCSESIR